MARPAEVQLIRFIEFTREVGIHPIVWVGAVSRVWPLSFRSAWPCRSLTRPSTWRWRAWPARAFARSY